MSVTETVCDRCGGTDGVSDDASRCGWCRPAYRIDLVSAADECEAAS